MTKISSAFAAIMSMKFDISFRIIHVTKKKLFDMKFDDIGLQGVAEQSKILFSSVLSLCKLYEIVFY